MPPMFPTGTPSGRHQGVVAVSSYIVTARDLDEAIHAVSNVYCNHTVAPRGPVGSVNAELKVAQAGNHPIVYLRYSAPVIVDAGRFPNLLLMMTASAGAASVDQNHRTSAWRSGQTIPLSPGRDTTLSFDRAFAQTSLRVDIDRLESMCAHWLGHPLDRPITFALRPLSESFEPVWQDAMRMALTLTAEEREIPLNAVAALEEFLLSLILHSHPHNYTEELTGRLDATAPRLVKEAKQIFSERAESLTTVSDVAKELGVSLRSLQAGFRRSEQTTPFACLRKVRLEAARRILMQQPGEISVMEVALRLGFTHAGRFGADYKAAFGETPVTTLRRHRQRESAI
jgi:AraC-like DNA-binding protein